jgi:hypothetical protein
MEYYIQTSIKNIKLKDCELYALIIPSIVTKNSIEFRTFYTCSINLNVEDAVFKEWELNIVPC